MTCPCGGELKRIVIPLSGLFDYAYCDKCKKTFTWKEYRALQADKIIELVKEQESK